MQLSAAFIGYEVVSHQATTNSMFCSVTLLCSSDVTVFSLSAEDDNDASAPTDSPYPAFLSCKGCGQLLGDSPVGAGLDLGLGLELGAELYCLTCLEKIELKTFVDSSQVNNPNLSDEPFGSDKKKKSTGKEAAATSTPSKLYSCSLCTFTTRYSNHLKRHMKIHNGQKPFRCPVCPYASAQLVNLQRHARTHTGEKPYRCQQCSYACSSLGNLRRHQRMHMQEKPQRPEKHKKRGQQKKTHAESEEVVSDLTLRISQVSGFFHTLGGLGSPSAPLPVLLFPLSCQVCGLTLEEVDLQESKANEEEEGEEERGPVCRRCLSDLMSKDESGAAVSHGPRSDRRRTQMYQCPHCAFKSHYPNHLTRHALIHSEEKPHHCPHCPYTSSHLDNLKRHTRVHTGEKPYQCPSCSYACGNLANLRRHERIHSGAKPFHCGVCSYSCNQSMNLKRHMLRHTGEKPYACAECDYTTGHWDNYKRHQRKHGHNTDSWDKHNNVHSVGWMQDTQDAQETQEDTEL
uniref:Zinc finger protein 513 n=1 Tax=Cynoglossus semilaevis TaxID=244447 RepID=A0A3P8VJX6_CYNSE